MPTVPMPRVALASRLTPAQIRHATRNQFLVPVARGHLAPWIPEGPDSHQGYIAALQALTFGKRVVGHETAASLWGFLPQPLGPPLHLIQPSRSAHTRHVQLLRSHRQNLPAEFIRVLQEIPVTDPAWTWTDLGLKLPLLDGLILADSALRPGRPEFGEKPGPLATREDLNRAINARGRVNRVRQLRQVSALARPGADSPKETTLRYYMYRAGLPEPQVNVWLLDEHGRRVVQPDLSVEKYRLAIQYEGQSVHSDPEQVLRDVRRQERTEALGWVEVRITKEHMRHSGAGAIAKITRALRKQGWRG